MATENRPVTTTAPRAILEAAKKKGISVRSLIIRGWQAEENFPAMLERQHELEEKLQRTRIELEHTSREMYRLRDLAQGGERK